MTSRAWRPATMIQDGRALGPLVLFPALKLRRRAAGIIESFGPQNGISSRSASERGVSSPVGGGASDSGGSSASRAALLSLVASVLDATRAADFVRSWQSLRHRSKPSPLGPPGSPIV